MRFFLFIILTFITCNLIAKENPIQQIDKETFCKEAIQETEKNECYEIKKYVDEFLYEQWFGIYNEEDAKIGYSSYIETLREVDEKYYYIAELKDVYVGSINEEWGEGTYSSAYTFQTHYPFKLVTAEVVYEDVRYIGVTKDNDIVVTKKSKEEETKTIIKEFNYNLYDFVAEGPWLIEHPLKVGDVFNMLSLDLTLLEEEGKIVDNLQYKLQGIESRVINEQSVKVFIFDFFYEDVNGNYKKFGQEVFDEKFHSIEVHYYYDDSSYNEIHILAPEEIARQIHYGDAIYLGEHQAGLPHGTGKMNYGDGEQYEGEFRKGQIHGKGTIIFYNGAKYEGDWVNGHYEGYGKFYYTDGGSYEGEWSNSDKHGYGKQIAVEGDIYEGEWFEDKRRGYGKLYYVNGDVYEGDWFEDKLHGQGTYTFANGDVYEGKWEKGKFVN